MSWRLTAQRRVSRTLLALVALALAVALLVVWSDPARADTFTVKNTKDKGKGSLRKAIKKANNNPGPDEIHFNIRGEGVKTIKLASPLPIITDPVTIDGYTQPGALRAGVLSLHPDAILLIELNGTNAGAGANGLTIRAAGSTIEGLVINRFDGNGIEMQGSGATNNEVLGNFIGTNADGTAALGNGNNGVRSSADNNIIGGTVSAARNIISGNQDDGIDLGGAAGNEVLGNFIGTNAAGTASLGNTRAGVAIFSASDNTIGGTAAGERNVISGNESDGVEISGSTATSNEVEGNFIGTDKNGTADLGNGDDGVKIASSAANNTIGGTTSGARNIISGNQDDGVFIVGDDTSNTTGNNVQGNRIGTNAAGTAALPNNGEGVEISQADDNTVGGTAAAARNIISANLGDGVVLFGSDATGNKVQGNFIGTAVNGASALGNDDGVVISSANGSTIGSDIGSTAGGNRIAHNAQDGVLIVGGAAVGNSVLSNSIFSNGGSSNVELGIDLGSEGVTANDTDDPDASNSSNHLQNFPEDLSAIRSNTTNVTIITGTLDSNPNQSFTIQFFVAAPDPSGHGEGLIFLGQTTAATNANGDGSFTLECPSADCPDPVGVGQTVTATATNTSGTATGTAIGDTSEFSLNFGVVAGP